ncbi:MAG: hypothetical protein MK137_04955 [Rickettsiales bacterium]|nr:hypothetical protein [Rickettsiales bacterium]
MGASIVAKPLNSMKLRQQTSREPLSVHQAYQQVIKGGPRNLWRGGATYALQQGGIGVTGGVPYEEVKKNKTIEGLPAIAKIPIQSAAAGVGEYFGTGPIESHYYTQQLKAAQKEGRKGFRAPPKSMTQHVKQFARMGKTAIPRNIGSWASPIAAAHIAEQNKLSAHETAALGAAFSVPTAVATSRLDKKTNHYVSLTTKELAKRAAQEAKLTRMQRLMPQGTSLRAGVAVPYAGVGAVTALMIREYNKSEAQQR